MSDEQKVMNDAQNIALDLAEASNSDYIQAGSGLVSMIRNGKL